MHYTIFWLKCFVLLNNHQYNCNITKSFLNAHASFPQIITGTSPRTSWDFSQDVMGLLPERHGTSLRTSWDFSQNVMGLLPDKTCGFLPDIHWNFSQEVMEISSNALLPVTCEDFVRGTSPRHSWGLLPVHCRDFTQGMYPRHPWNYLFRLNMTPNIWINLKL